MEKYKPLHIAIIGTRGIPNRYGGFEAFAQKLAPWLHNRGHHVSVYCSHYQEYQGAEWEGVKLVHCYNPERRMGTAGQFVYDLVCNWDARKKGFDVILHLGYTSDSVWSFLWASGAKHITNMDGMEWKRSKYNALTKRFLHYAERRAVKGSDTLVADSVAIGDYLEKNYAKRYSVIAYGADIPSDVPVELLDTYNLEAQKYDLLIARMEPENNIELAIEAKLKANDSVPLHIISNQNQYAKCMQTKYEGNALIVFHKADYRQDVLDALRRYARYYVHGHSVGGTNPSLLEAMACGCKILAHRNEFNQATLKDAGLYFSNEEELSQLFGQEADSSTWQKMRKEAVSIINTDYKWEQICSAYEKLFMDIS